jgi:hypothetical protein
MKRGGKSSELGVFQQNKGFGQRDAIGFRTECLSDETRLNIKDCIHRIHRILNKEQKGEENDWRNKKVGEASFKLQGCEIEHKGVYSDPKRLNVAELIADAFYSGQASMLAPPKLKTFESIPSARHYAGPVGKNARTSNVIQKVFLTRPIDPHSVVDACKVRGIDSSFESRAKLGRQYGIQGIPGSAEFNTALLRRLG